MSVVKLTDPITFFNESGIDFEPINVCDIKNYSNELVNKMAEHHSIFITTTDSIVRKEANQECKELISKVKEINPRTKFYIEKERS